MMNKRKLAPVAGSLLLLAGAATSVSLVAGGSATAAGSPSSAYGIELSIAGNGIIPKMPAVTSADGSVVTNSVIGLPDNPVATGGVLNATAENGAATASVADLTVGASLLKSIPQLSALTGPLTGACNQLTSALSPLTGPVNDALVGTLLPQVQGILDQVADATKDTPLNLGALGALDLSALTNLQLSSLCNMLAGDVAIATVPAVTAKCTGNTGTVNVTDLKVLGQALPVVIDTKKANQAIKIPDMPGVPAIVELVVNKQTANADGTFTVDALSLSVLGQINVNIASATCGNVTSDVAQQEQPGQAPEPKPVKKHVAVTG